MIYKILLLFMVLLPGCGGGEMAAKRPLVVSFYGDSITSGTHSAKYDEWIPVQWDVSPVQYISSISGIQGVDYSENGANAADASIKLDNSDIAVIRFGVADAYHGTQPDDFAKSITRLVAEARVAGKLVILTGLTHNAFNNTDPLNEVMRERAASLCIPFVDVYSLAYSPSVLADPLHPGLDYSRRIGQLVSVKILEIIK